MERDRIIGITGGIGAGKSVVSRILRLRGYHVYDCDFEAALIRDSSPDARELISHKAPDAIIASGRIDTAVLRNHFFSDSDLRDSLNTLIHKRVTEDIKDRRKMLDSARTLFIESAIMNSSGLVSMLSGLWIVQAPDSVKIERVKIRNGMRHEDIEGIMKVQQAEEMFDNAYAVLEYIYNDDNHSLLAEIDELTNKYKL